ncbi:MAG: hypothetical protein HC905_00180 [Bacteroidales bacterium]|nr:hypothetical protein [Bacteroidales bacterium]
MEHFTGTLSKPLHNGRKYLVSFYISYADSFSPYMNKGIGCYFSKVKEPFKSWSPPFYERLVDDTYKPHICSSPDSAIGDTAWVKISGVYIAKGGEKYITLGKFYDKKVAPKLVNKYIDNHFDLLKTKEFVKKYSDIMPFNEHHIFPTEGLLHGAYYFIDDVSVVEIKD